MWIRGVGRGNVSVTTLTRLPRLESIWNMNGVAVIHRSTRSEFELRRGACVQFGLQLAKNVFTWSNSLCLADGEFLVPVPLLGDSLLKRKQCIDTHFIEPVEQLWVCIQGGCVKIYSRVAVINASVRENISLALGLYFYTIFSEDDACGWFCTYIF